MVPSQLTAERGPNLVVINPGYYSNPNPLTALLFCHYCFSFYNHKLQKHLSGSANIRIGLATHDTPFNIPHCIARYTSQVPKKNVQDQVRCYRFITYIFKVFLIYDFLLVDSWIWFGLFSDAQFSDYYCSAHGA